MSGAWLALPGLLWLVTFMGIPLLFVIACAFVKKGVYGGIVFELTVANLERVLDPLYLRVVLNSVWLASWTTAVCLVLAFPMAYAMVRARGRLRGILFLLAVMPFWSGLVVRVFSIRSLLSDWIGSPVAVAAGMISTYLPFMVLPIYVSLEKLDFSLVEAAHDLGATYRRALTKVLLPMIAPGVLSGSVLVFTPALGEFLIPDLLGGAKTMLLGNLITDQYLKARDWPFGSALALMLLVLIFGVVVFTTVSREARRARQVARSNP